MEFYEHQGTHIDAPSHFGKGRQSMEQIPPEKLMGPGVVIDVKDKVKVNPDYAVSVDDILGEFFFHFINIFNIMWIVMKGN